MCAIITGTKIYYTEEQKTKKVYETIDKLILVLPDFENFHIHDYYKIIEPNSEERRKLRSISSAIRIAMELLNYIENPPTFNNLHRLTERGREVKNKGGHQKYLKSQKPKKDWTKVLSIGVSIIFGIISSVFLLLNYKLNKENIITKIEIESLKKENDSLKTQLKFKK